MKGERVTLLLYCRVLLRASALVSLYGNFLEQVWIDRTFDNFPDRQALHNN